jgi:hypothetical protein
MGKQIITVLTDDLDGGDADRTIEFGLDGVNHRVLIITPPLGNSAPGNCAPGHR